MIVSIKANRGSWRQHLNNNSEKMNELQEDVLKEIANIGSGHAATALAELLGRPIVQSLPSVRLVPLAEIPELLGGAEKVAVVGMLRITGDFAGYLMMVLDFEQAVKIISMVRGRRKRQAGQSPHRFSAMEKSVLSETVNIMGGSYLTAIAEFTNLKVAPSVPYLCVDMVGAVISVAVAETGKAGDFAVLFQSELFNEKERIIGDLFLIPDESSCNTIFQSLGML
jgi:chemotaxis protein CheC